MNDSQRINALEKQVGELKSQFAKLALAVAKLTRSSDSGRQSTQAAVDDLQRSIQLIFTNVEVPNVNFKPGRRLLIS